MQERRELFRPLKAKKLNYIYKVVRHLINVKENDHIFWKEIGNNKCSPLQDFFTFTFIEDQRHVRCKSLSVLRS